MRVPPATVRLLIGHQSPGLSDTHVNPGPLLDRSIEEVAAVFDANVLSVLRVCKAAVPHMAARKHGLIVNIGSVVGEMCVPPDRRLRHTIRY